MRAIAILALLLAAAGLARADEEADRIAWGKAFAEQNCSRCHNVGPAGASPHPDAPPFRRFQTMWPLEYLEEPLAEGIVVGHPDMPEFVLVPSEIDALLAYMASLPAEE